jgi:hypothetical protein
MHSVEPAFLPSSDHRRREPELSFDKWIGEKVADLAALLGLAVLEHQENGEPPRREVKARGAELLSKVVKLALYDKGFHEAAAREGKGELRRRAATSLIEIDDAWLDYLVDEALKMVSGVVRKVTN